jgi:hypothetical protein
MSSKYLLTFSLILLTALPLDAACDKILPRTLSYNIDLKFDFSSNKLYGRAEIGFMNGSYKAIDTIPLLLYRLISVKSDSNEKGEPMTFRQNVVSISGWEQIQVNWIKIPLPASLQPGDVIKIVVDYDGYMLGYSAEGKRYVKDHIDKNFTLIRPDGLGYPMVGLPDNLNIMAIIKERYDFRINRTVPGGVMAVTGGKLTGRCYSFFNYLRQLPEIR